MSMRSFQTQLKQCIPGSLQTCVLAKCKLKYKCALSLYFYLEHRHDRWCRVATMKTAGRKTEDAERPRTPQIQSYHSGPLVLLHQKKYPLYIYICVCYQIHVFHVLYMSIITNLADSINLIEPSSKIINVLIRRER